MEVARYVGDAVPNGNRFRRMAPMPRLAWGWKRQPAIGDFGAMHA